MSTSISELQMAAPAMPPPSLNWIRRPAALLFLHSHAQPSVYYLPIPTHQEKSPDLAQAPGKTFSPSTTF